MTAFVIFAGIELQRELESLAYKMGEGNNNAPAQLVGDFLQGGHRKRYAAWCHPISPQLH